MNWDGILPRRRYAIFSSPFVTGGKYAIVVYGNDIETAEKWSGFVSWLGGVRPAETRNIKRPNTACTRLETGAANADSESNPAVSSG